MPWRHMASGGIAPLILNLGTTWWWSASHPNHHTAGYLLHKRSGRPTPGYGGLERKKSLDLTLGHGALSLGTKRTKSSRIDEAIYGSQPQTISKLWRMYCTNKSGRLKSKLSLWPRTISLRRVREPKNQKEASSQIHVQPALKHVPMELEIRQVPDKEI
jgi:hypothetical protein